MGPTLYSGTSTDKFRSFADRIKPYHYTLTNFTIMKMQRNATATWKGTGKEGTGSLTTQSTVLSSTQYSFNTRFADGIGTNPEELLAAAHAGCYSMKLSFVLNAAGFTAEEITTKCVVTLEDAGITSSTLSVQAKVPGISEDQFRECAEDAKANCPVSKVYNCEIKMDTNLVA